MERISREVMLMRIAHVAASRGTCGRLSVGAIIARESRPISLGYVGAPANEPHCDEAHCDLTLPCARTLHAEANAIAFAESWHIDTIGCDMFVTHAPCIICARLILGASIRRVYFEYPYRLTEGIELLRGRGLSVHRINTHA